MTKRKQYEYVKTGRKGRIILCVFLSVLILLIISGATFAWLNPAWVTSYIASFRPPMFEENAAKGVPAPDENYAYSPVSAEGGYAFSLAGNLYRQEDGSLNVYFTNPDDSEVWIMMEVYSLDLKKILYRSGILKQGEYVETLQPIEEFSNEATKIEVRVYGYEPENYQSKGTVYLYTTLQPW